MHVDGFRFDEALDPVPRRRTARRWTIRRSCGTSSCPTTLADTKIIAEAWDAGGLYQVGYFPGYRWAEWNGRYRDDVRRFVKGDTGLVGAVASRHRAAAPTSTRRAAQLPINSINFITATTASRSTTSSRTTTSTTRPTARATATATTTTSAGTAASRATTDDPAIEALRGRQIRNFPTILMLSQGVPMMVMGDEARQHPARQQQRLLPGQRDHLVRLDAGREARRPVALLQRADRLPQAPADASGATRSSPARSTSAGWPTSRGTAAACSARGWDDPESRVLAFTLGGFDAGPASRADRHGHPRDDEHGLAGRWTSTSRPSTGRRWHRAIDTSAAVARTTSPSPGHEPVTRATRTGSATAASWCSSRSRSRRRDRVQQALSRRIVNGGEISTGEDRLEGDGEGRDGLHVLRHDRRLRQALRPRTRTASRITTSDGREFTVKLTDDDRSPSWSATSASRTSTRPARCATCSSPGATCSPTASSIPRAATHVYEAKHLIFLGARAPTTTCSRSRTGGSSRSARWPTSTCGAQFGRTASSTAREYRVGIDIDGPQDRRPPGDRHDLAARLRLRHGLPHDRRGPLPRGGRGGASTCASTCATSTAARA